MANIEFLGKTPDGIPVSSYELSCDGVTARVMDFGATLLSLSAPNRDGAAEDIVLGFDRLDDYFDNPACYGATVGPSANRTDLGQVTIGEATYQMPKNDGPDSRNNLHTDLADGLHKRVWNVEPADDDSSVTFSITLADGDYGLPGNRWVTTTYALVPSPEGGVALTLHYRCESDAPTFVNMTNHTYWNLAGHASGLVLNQLVGVNASHYLPLRSDNVSLGEVADVAGTPFDFRQAKELGRDIELDNEQLAQGRGYDHCLCVDGYDGADAPRRALHAEDPASGRTLDISITTPGAHLYTGNWLDDADAKDGATYTPRCGFAFEPEFWPDNMHHADWVHPVCRPGQPYEQTIVYRFSSR